MAISIKKYVDIKSSTNTTRTATEKELIARIFVNNNKLEPNKVYEFDTLASVGEFFGFTSEEYKIAEKYFGFINKYSRKPKKISFYRDWRNGINAELVSVEKAVLTELQAITDGSLKISINDKEKTISSIDLSSATSLSDVASTLQTAIRAVAGTNEDMFSNATVIEDEGVFVVTSGIKDYGNIHIVEETALSQALAFVIGENEYDGRPEDNLQNVFKESYQVSNNFATYTFINNFSTANDIATLANYVKENYPSEFMTVVPVNYDNKDTIQEAVKNIDGVSLELCGDNQDNGKYNYIMPMVITATTDYNKENGTVNYMYTQYAEMSNTVDNDYDAEENDKIKVNYYGQTQKSGQKLAFYQNGVLQGNYQDQSIFVNEIWLKDALTTKYINYMLLTSNWYANKAGQAIGQGLAQDVIDRAKLNGTITTEKEISEADKVYIYNITADENAWRQIYQEGYYLMTSIEKKTINNQETYTFNYTLLYSKGDSIKKVEGLNILI